MSLFTLVSTAVAVPLTVVVVVFIWFAIRAQLAQWKRKWMARRQEPYVHPVAVSLPAGARAVSSAVPMPAVAPGYVAPPPYQPLAHFLDATLSDAARFDLRDIPGIDERMQYALNELGYSSVDQIARWGRADVRAVSARLGVDQHIIEEEWIEGARLILSIR